MNVRKSISSLLSEVNTENQKFEVASMRVVLEDQIQGETATVREIELQLIPVAGPVEND